MYKIIGGDQKEYGPVSFDQLAAWVRDNRANGQSLVQREGGPWVPMGTLQEFAGLLAAAAGETSAPGPGTSQFGSQPGSTPDPIPSFGPAPGASIGVGAGVPGQGEGGFGGGGAGVAGGYPGGMDPGPGRAREMVQGPATALIVTGVLGMIAVVLGVVFGLMGSSMAPPPGDMPPEMKQVFDMMRQFQSPGMIIADAVIKLAVAGLILFGAGRLRNLKSFPLVVTAAILAIVPCTSPCCCVGIPVGIWVLVVLFKPEVKSAFR